VVFDLNFIEGLVGAAFAESGEVGDGHEEWRSLNEETRVN
jgi:hypothetical protein